jgi:RimJ/RimL family protein N-acetyltransferase
VACSPELLTPRLVLRQFTAADHDAYAALCADEDVMRFIGAGGTLSHDDAWRSLAGMLGHWALRGHGQWALEERATGVLVGRAGFIDPPGWPGFELGYLLGRAHWGRGYAAEACRAALGQAWNTLGRDHAISLIRPDNARSIRLAERLGATRTDRIDFMGGPTLVYRHEAPAHGHAG